MADDLVIQASLDAAQASRDLDEFTRTRTVDVELQPVNVEKTIQAIDRRLDQLGTELVVAVAEDRKDNVKTLKAKIKALSRRKDKLTLEVEADTGGAVAAVRDVAQDQNATVRVDEVGAAQVAAEIDRAAEDRTSTISVAGGNAGDLDALIMQAQSLPGIGGVVNELDAATASAGGLSQALSTGGIAGAAKAAGPFALIAAGVAADKAALDLATGSLEKFITKTEAVSNVSAFTDTVDEAARLVSIVEGYGAEVDDIADGLGALQAATADGSLAELGVNVDPGSSAYENLAVVSDLYSRLGTDAERVALATAAFGEGNAATFVPLIEDGADAMDRMASAVDPGTLISGEDVENGERLDQALRNLEQTWDTFQVGIGTDLAEPAIEFLEVLNDARPVISALGKLFSVVVGGAVSQVAGFLESQLYLVQKLVDGADVLLGPLADFDDDLFGLNDEADGAAEGLGSAAGAAGDLSLNLGDAKTEAELLAEAIERVNDQISGIIDPYADLASGSVRSDDIVNEFDAQREAAAGIAEAITEAKERQRELNGELADSDLSSDKRADLEAELAEVTKQANVTLPVGVALTELTPEKVAEIEAAFPDLTVPTRFDAEKLASDLAQAVQEDVFNRVELGDIPLGGALDEIITRLGVVNSQQVSLGVDPATTERLDLIIGKLKAAQAEVDKIVGKAAAEAAAAAGRSGASADAAERAGESARAAASVELNVDDTAAKEAIAGVTGRQPPAKVDVDVTGTSEADAEIDAVAKPRTARVTVRASGLRTILDQLAQIKSKTITVTVESSQRVGPPQPLFDPDGNWAGGLMRSGEVARVAEYGPEVFEGVSGRRLVLTGDGAFSAPEAGYVVSGAETARRYPHLVGSTHNTTRTDNITVNVYTPDARLAGRDVLRAVTDRKRQGLR